MKLIRRNLRLMAAFLVVELLGEMLAPQMVMALTSGPTQPEVTSFEPVGTTEMVDLFSGDFTYNVPLFELPGPNGGYPFNLAYHGGVTMDQEASWVGLGWSLNPGAINRQMRGLPDDFKEDTIKTKFSMKPQTTVGVSAGVGVEAFGSDLSGLYAGGSLDLQIYYNNYKGIGYSLGITPSLGYGFGDGTPGVDDFLGLGVSLSFDSQEGVGVSPRLSFSGQQKNAYRSYSIGFDVNSQDGLVGLSLGTTASNTATSKDSDSPSWAKGSGSYSSSYSFAAIAKTPTVKMPMGGWSAKLNFAFGLANFGTYPYGRVGGTFSIQRPQKSAVSKRAFGYLYLQDDTDNKGLLDFDREKDGVVSKASPNLAVPVLTNDVYSVTGQGMAAMYRPYRSDIGRINDPRETSFTGGGSLGLEFGVGLGGHFGGDLQIFSHSSKSGVWETDLHESDVDFQAWKPGSLFEPVYFQAYGEHSTDPLNELDHIGGTTAMRPRLDKSGLAWKAEKKMERGSGGIITLAQGPKVVNEERAPRSKAIQHFTNEQLGGAELALPLFSVPYKNESGTKNYLDRGDYKKHHIGGYQVVNEEGLRYVYGLPAYNNKQVECLFSLDPGTNNPGPITTNFGEKNGEPNYDVKRTDKFYQRTETPRYAHAYLLTSIVGADYVDADYDPAEPATWGPSEGDHGYWVRFNYQRMSTDYKWRAPLYGANYIQGYRTTRGDDKGSYVYGEKELWYLESVETSSHIAVFHTSAREDAHGASKEVATSSSDIDMSKHSFRLDSVELFSKRAREADQAPIKVVHFKYDYTLCNGVQNWTDQNGITDGTGKLTLRKLYFTYGQSNRGKLSPYQFGYGNENPDYSSHQYDRWGGYHRLDSLGHGNWNALDFPYTVQYSTLGPESLKDSLDKYAGAWSLKQITLPSGGKIDVEYEADDYAFVQDKPAMQMMNVWVDKSDGNGPGSRIVQGRRRLYFELESSLSADAGDAERLKEVNKYLRGVDQVYFRALMTLREDGDFPEEYISGYAKVNPDQTKRGLWRAGGSGVYTHGYFDVEPMKGSKGRKYHPFSSGAWQHLRSEQPLYANLGGRLYGDGQEDEGEKLNKARINSLIGAIPNAIKMFKDFNEIAKNRDWGVDIKPEQSWIRLSCPDQIKYGGGHRVRSIVLTDAWDEMTGQQSSKQGQYYDYTMVERGNVISSGVATYEPMVGGDENPFRRGKEYSESKLLKTNNNLFFEMPVNESYFPGATVGYRKVTVKTLTSHRLGLPPEDAQNLPTSVSGTGATVHEFYTAKEFPVIVQETAMNAKPDKPFFFGIPFVGSVKITGLAASQGYSVELNDMHGKPKQVSHYAQRSDGTISNAPVSYSKYNYLFEQEFLSGDSLNVRYRLTNKVMTLTGEYVNGQAQKEERLMGVDYEFFSDLRENKDVSTNTQIGLGVDIIPALFFPIPIPSAWPTTHYQATTLRTAVTNKVIHRSGIMTGMEVYDRGSLVRSEYKLFDALTGRPVLTETTNNYDAPIYSYSMPAHLIYDGMGPAYKNIGLTFTEDVSPVSNKPGYYAITPGVGATWQNHLVPGDEFVVSKGGAPVATGQKNVRAIYEGKNGSNDPVFLFEDALSSEEDLNFFLTRSGRRNHLSVDVQSVVAMEDPTSERVEESCTTQVVFPIIDGERAYLSTLPSEIARTVNGIMNAYRNENIVDCGCVDSTGICSGCDTIYPEILYRFTGLFPPVDSLLPTPPTYYWLAKLNSESHHQYQNEFYPLSPDYQYIPVILSCEALGDDCDVFPDGIFWDDKLHKDTAAFNVSLMSSFDSVMSRWVYVNRGGVLFGGNSIPEDYVERRAGGGPIHQDFAVFFDATDGRIIPVWEIDSLYDPWIPRDMGCGINTYDSTCYASLGYNHGPQSNWGGEGVHYRMIKTNGDTIIALHAISGIPWRTYWETGPYLTLDTTDVVSSAYLVDDILSISATTFDDAHPLDFASLDTTQQVKAELGDRPFYHWSTGEKGTWRPDASYTYVDARSQTPGMNLSVDGTMDDVPLFNFDDQLFTQCYPKWRQVNTITEYSPFSFELENKDILDRYSAALYGYDGQLTTAVAANARNREIGYEGFEEYTVGQALGVDNLMTGNLDFLSQSPGAVNLESWQSFEVLSGNDSLLILPIPYSSAEGIEQIKVAGAKLGSGTEKTIWGQYDVSYIAEHPTDPLKSIWVLSGFGHSGLWAGQAWVPQLTPADFSVNAGGGVGISTVGAHTGTNSLRVATSVSVPQSRLWPQAGQRYVVSAWMRPESATSQFMGYSQGVTGYVGNAPASVTSGAKVNVYASDGAAQTWTLIGTISPTGGVVEGWQRVEGEFDMPAGYSRIRLELVSPQIDGQFAASLWDDMRVLPSDASMRTYVYDTETLRLSATLDDQNFATLYFYNEAGQLYLTQKETSSGIRTIQQSRVHMKETNE